MKNARSEIFSCRRVVVALSDHAISQEVAKPFEKVYRFVWLQQCEFNFDRWLITHKMFLNTKRVNLSISILGTSFADTGAFRVEILISRVQIGIQTCKPMLWLVGLTNS